MPFPAMVVLVAADGPTRRQGGQPAPGAIHIPTGLPNPTDPTTVATLVMHFPDDGGEPDDTGHPDRN